MDSPPASSSGPLTAPVARRVQGQRARFSAWLQRTGYLQRWLVLGMAIGVVAGVGAVVFYAALGFATHVFLDLVGHYQVPLPRGEGNRTGSTGFARPWAIPLIACGGALVGGILVHRFAPDAAGHGTDAAISAVHDQPRGIKLITVAVKIVASALTIGSGGSGGREGPTGQISAGFGSLLARVLDLTPADARTAVATGIGSGIGSIFGAPLGGAVLATEILYRDDADFSVLLPGFIASIVGYVIFASVYGFQPIFGFVGGYRFAQPIQLLWFAGVGILGGVVGLTYAKVFYGFERLFLRLRVPGWSRPAIGGLLVGLIALGIPQVIGTGYGWVQQALEGRQLLGIPLWIVLLVPFARIVATGLSIGSGGSGGIFGPGMVIGAFMGAAVWRLVEPWGGTGHNPAPFVIIGMMCCFGSIARAPLAVMLMVAEMTGNLTILVPAMIAVGVATLIVSQADDSIYRSQVRSRSDAPSQRLLMGLPLLASLPVARACVPPKVVLSSPTTVEEATRTLTEHQVPGAPVVDTDQLYVGTVSTEALGAQGPESAGTRLENNEALNRNASSLHADRHLDVGLELLTAGRPWVTVVDDRRRVVGTLAISDVVRAYRIELQHSLRQLAVLGDADTTLEMVVSPGSWLAGRVLREAELPAGVIVTTLQRGRELMIPQGSTTLEPGDRLVVLGRPDDLSGLRERAGAEGAAAVTGDRGPPGGPTHHRTERELVDGHRGGDDERPPPSEERAHEQHR